VFPIIIHTDGACSGNPGPGGWAAIVLTPDGAVTELGGRESHTTNNRMELAAALAALRSIRNKASLPVEIHTDSTYLIGGITQWIHAWKRRGWVKDDGEPVQNRDLWEALDRLVGARRQTGPVTWHYVRGHRGTPGNERCDAIAVAFSRSQRPRLYRGTVLDYPLDLLERPDDTRLPETSRRLKPAQARGPVTYQSLVDDQLERHLNWEDCKRRVHGRSGARYKKCSSPDEERALLAAWGRTDETLGDDPVSS
jgi:ribonuclease HI